MAKFNASSAAGSNNDAFDLKSGPYAPMIQFQKGDSSIGKALSKSTKVSLGDIEDVSYHGGFFITLENCPKQSDGSPVDLTQYGWRKDSFTSKSGKSAGEEIEGYTRREIRVAACSMRQTFDAIKRSGDSFDRIGSYPTYNEANKHGDSVSGKVQVLVVVEGMEHFGKFVLTFNGHTQMAITGAGSYSGVFNDFRKSVIAAANAESSGTYPYRSFWMTIRASQGNDGAPRFISAGKGVNSRAIVVPEFAGSEVNLGDSKSRLALLNDVYVGDELKATFDVIAEEAQGWREEWSKALVNEKDDDAPDEGTPFDDEDAENLI